MAANIVLFLLITSAIIFNEAAAQQRSSNITLGSSLTPTSNISSWFSPSRQYAFGFYPQTNINNGSSSPSSSFAVGIYFASISTQPTVVWTANRDNNPTDSADAVLTLTRDGRLVLQQNGEQSVDVVSGLSEPISSASMLDNGNFVLLNSENGVIWQSFDNPTDTLLPGQRLRQGQELISSVSETDPSRRGIFRIKMQEDGNLVQYPVNTPDAGPFAYYASNTAGSGNNVTLNLDINGRLYLLNGTSSLRNITSGEYPTSGTSTLARIDADGIFRVYYYSLESRNWTVLWSSTEDKCNPKGLCGLNGFCIQLDERVDCRCLPGFDFIQPGNWSAGCSRNFTAEVCRDEDRTIYEIRTVNNAVWEDNAYAALRSITEEGCRQACLDDCNCEAAFFKDSQCRKQRLPLRYGRKLVSDSNKALIKVSTPATETTDDPKSNSGGGTKKELRLDILIISIALFAFSVLVFAISGVYVCKKQARAYDKVRGNREVNLAEDFGGLCAFSYAELVTATGDFKEELGRGASGTVYKGILFLGNSQKMVAVKRLDIKELIQGEKEFQNEMKVIGKMYHRNLVRLLGYCLDGPNRLLVFEYMSNGSLADVLFKTSENRPFWGGRLRIARDVARGILYLHEECETQIIHCDIKPQNILMDEHYSAKISDFGLSKLLKQDQTKTYTGIRGTKGYVAPEWHRKEPVTVKADIYSFGILLLEIVCCRKSVDWSLPEDEAILEEWVYNCYESREMRKLVGDEMVESGSLERMVKIGIWCIQAEPSLRPSIKKVLLMLEGTVDIPIPPNPTSFLSSIE